MKWLRKRARQARENGLVGRIAALVIPGDDACCPCCGMHFARFRGLNGPDRVCWGCGSLERHRSVSLLLDRRPDLIKPGMSILHVAPEPALRRRLNTIPNVRYVGGDLDAQFGPERIDITDLAFGADTFDAVVCNHVLEHVPDDLGAMREIRRVLKPGGWALLLVPDIELGLAATDEDCSLTDPAERIRRFGQADHVRRYGRDYADRLTEAGFSVTVQRPDEIFDAPLVQRSHLLKFGKAEPIYIAL